MKKVQRIVAVLFALASLAIGCFAAGEGASYKAVPSADKTTLNGSPVTMQAYKINNNNYVKLRDFANLVNNTPNNFEVVWDQSLNAINLYTKKPYTAVGGEGTPIGVEEKQAKETDSAIYVNGEQVSLKGYNINNNNYFKLRDLGSALGIGIDWDNTTKTVVVDSMGTGGTGEQGGTETPETGSTEVEKPADPEGTSEIKPSRVINNKIGPNGYPDGATIPLEERLELGRTTTLPPTDVNHPGWCKGGTFMLATLKPGEEIPPAASYAYAGIERTPEAWGSSWSGVSVGGGQS